MSLRLTHQTTRTTHTRKKTINHYECFCGHSATERGMVTHLENYHGHPHDRALDWIREARDKYKKEKVEREKWGLKL